ncbi:uncharacterized protein Dwil_GK11492 [Drosophila willistoni]|uniref:Uncharacterized protein n=1 Tax=Drosophila willistoni TaxID=7260 RepID=B4N9D7_DROWI|nr:uncharacterized protein LOC6647634 [Drosophila willistoni]EDW80570.1 uncharacterized protein Dwil_GK11492 [Drosophila willistoni]
MLRLHLQVLLLSGLLAVVCWGDTLVQLHVNRPYNDVSEKFVSFAVKPEDLYDALDGKNRKAVTSMAALLGDAYIKFIGDFYFATNAPTRLRNPTKIIWKGFNRWTRAVNWTMIVPVPYAPDEWDSMHTLKILNTSYMVGISDCIWQLGTDFGTSRAKDYVQELSTLKLMTDTFKPYVDNWRVMGADISAGSTADETRKYVEMSKDLNAAFGWTQPANMLPKASLGSYIYDSDPALKILQQQRVPLWLTLPEERSSSKRLMGDDTTDALRWAQTLGDAASGGFDVVFKRMNLEDFERPNFSFYVTSLFKKVMGSRVFPARPLNVFAPSNKLYTHCANAVSGGLAFMVVNTEEQPTTITIRSLSKLASSEIWQYVLTSVDDHRVQLNNVRLSLNSTLRPLVKKNDASKPLQLVTPSMSVGFWVLPDVNLEHCQFTEIEADDPVSNESSSESRGSNRYSSADRLLQRLIEETSVTRGSLQNVFRRSRRFVLDNPESPNPSSLLGQLLQPLTKSKAAPASVVPAKREAQPKEATQAVRPLEAMVWLHQVMEQTRDVARRRGRRSASSYNGPYFYNKHGKRTGLTKKITEIRKPERKNKPLFNFDEFDEEKFFKKMEEQPEEPPSYTRVPEGDVHLERIETPDGEEHVEPEAEPIKKRRPKSKTQLKIVQRSQEEYSQEAEHQDQEHERGSRRLPPTEFFEAPKFGKPMNLGATLNSLLFPEPFSSKASRSKVKSKTKAQDELEEDVEPVEGEKNEKQRPSKAGQVANDFLQAQRELGKHFLSHISEHEHEFALGDENPSSDSSLETIGAAKSKPQTKDYFGAALAPKRLPKRAEGMTSWWEMPSFRRRRALPFTYSNEQLRLNAIDKGDPEDLPPLGGYSIYEYKVDLVTIKPEETEETTTRSESDSTIMKITKKVDSNANSRKITLSDSIVTTVKSKVSKFMNIISRHMSEWYNTLAKHLDTDTVRPQRQSTERSENGIDK